MSELKPCPFCGSPPKDRPGDIFGSYVACSNYNCILFAVDGDPESNWFHCGGWNRRAVPDLSGLEALANLWRNETNLHSHGVHCAECKTKRRCARDLIEKLATLRTKAEVWREFSKEPPLPVDQPGQRDIFWYSPGWATFMRGIFNRYVDGAWDLSEYSPKDDRFYEWDNQTPKYWMPQPTPCDDFRHEWMPLPEPPK